MAQVIQQKRLNEKTDRGNLISSSGAQQQLITPEETEIEQTTAKIEKIQQATESKMMQVVQKRKFRSTGFNQITFFVAVRQNPTLFYKSSGK